jgi:two-component system KDP operon response regulator KdpE
MVDRILIIEDDWALARLLQLEVQRHGFEVITVCNGTEGLRQFHEARPDLVVLDLVLPGIDGRMLCQRIRSLSDIPIFIITAQAASEEQIAHGLDMGADEFMLKPLRNIEFMARIRALLRRARAGQSNHRTLNDYRDDYLLVNLGARRVQIQGRDVRLTPTEFKLLAALVTASEQVLTFRELLETVWGTQYRQEVHYPRIYVSHLRRKIEPDPNAPTYIQNEYGVGYRFVSKVNAP